MENKNLEDVDISEIIKLCLKLNHYNYEYYNNNNSVVSDSEYDEMFDRLKSLECKSGIVLSNSPTHRVGCEVLSSLKKTSHSEALLSLDKTKILSELSDFLENRKYCIMSKIDGLTVKLVYKKGELVEASTRGDGLIGEDITHNAKTFNFIPLKLPREIDLTVVGEAIIHFNDFDTINSKLEESEKYKHPRNLVSGSVRQLSNKICSQRHVYFYAFNLMDSNINLPDSKFERFKILNSLGFAVTVSTISDDSSEETLDYYIKTIKNICNDKNIPIDGIVVTYDSVEYSDSKGKTSHHPLHSMAFKFEDEVYKTTIKDIEWSVGKNHITPVAILEPVEIDGTMISRASLHNLTIMQNLEIGIGDVVGVIKANMIIPQVVKNFTRSNNIKIPSNCPKCGGMLGIDCENESSFLVCYNDSCYGKVLKKLEHFCSKQAMNIEGLSKSTLEKFFDKKFIEQYHHIYELEKYKDDIINMDGFGEKSYNKLIKSIELSKNVDLNKFIYSLSIPLIGRTASKMISEYFDYSLDNLLDYISKYNNNDSQSLLDLNDFGENMHKSLISYFKDIKNINQLYLLSQYININKVEKTITKGKDLTGLTFVCTGSFLNYTRDSIKEKIELLGGKT